MPPDEGSQRAFERRDVERAAQTDTARRVIDRIAWLELVNKPESLLSKRERHHIPFPLRSLEPWCYAYSRPDARVYSLRQLANGRLFKQTPQCDLDPECLPHPRHHLRRQQRVTT